MAARLAWKGVLKLSLITIPIRVFPATDPASDVSFRQLHRKCRTPIQMKKWCPHCNIELSKDDIVKGYESSKGRYVLVEDEEITGLRPEVSHVVEISHLADAAAIDPIYIERTYYLAPDNKPAGSAFAVIREGLHGSAGIGRFALHGREYLVAVVPRDSALLAYTLRTRGEVRTSDSIEELKYGDVTPKAGEVKLARQVLHSFEPVADLSSFTDNYQTALRRMVAAKGEGDTVAGADKKRPAKVVNLMDALRESLARASEQKKRSAKAREKSQKAS